MNPMKKVTDPHSIIVNETPISCETNPAGVIGGLLDEEGADTGGEMRDSPPENEIGVGCDRRRLRTKADSSYKTPDCRPSRRLSVIVLRENPAHRNKGVSGR